MCFNLESVSSVKDLSYWGHMCLCNKFFSSQTFMLKKKSWEEIHVVLFPFKPSSGYLLFYLIVEKSEMTKLVPNVARIWPWLGMVWFRQSPALNLAAFWFVCVCWGGVERGYVYFFPFSFWSPSPVDFRLKSAWWHVYPFGFAFKTQSWQMCLMGLWYQVTEAQSLRGSHVYWLFWWGS